MSERLETPRLILRPPLATDVPAFTALLNDFEVVKNLTRVPHPYREEDGYAFVAVSSQRRAKKQGYAFLIQSREDGAVMGCCALNPDCGYELGYWLGRSYWGQGYATEAARRVVAFAFDELRAERIEAGWFHDNPASGRVLQKLCFLPDCTDERLSLSRQQTVLCNKVVLTREAYRKTRLQ